jgi:hypothetical protein
MIDTIQHHFSSIVASSVGGPFHCIRDVLANLRSRIFRRHGTLHDSWASHHTPICVIALLYRFRDVLQALPGQETPDGVPNFKMVLVGDGGTGTSPTHLNPAVLDTFKVLNLIILFICL